MRTETHRVVWLFCFLLFLATACTQNGYENSAPGEKSLEDEVIYHIFLRSFYDSNGDGHGDLEGLRQKLDYLQDLGITAILLTPLYESPFYHNYFPDDFEKIDPSYGSMADYNRLISDMHTRGMKLIMDMEIHYVTYEHKWYKDSYANPESPYSNYIIYNGPGNTQAESIIYNLDTVETWDGKTVGVCSIDLYDSQVQEYITGLFLHWMDPNQDGDFSDGVDGFRIDHMMDDLDWKGIRTDLLEKYWKPAFQEMRALNPDIYLIGEQAEWNYGIKYLGDGLVDAIFAFPIWDNLLKLDVSGIALSSDSLWKVTPEGRNQILMLENHDVDRFASQVDQDPGKQRIGAALNLFLKGVPSIYYGQEIGMIGRKFKFNDTAANDIPIREAFEWRAESQGSGMATWYKGDTPWWHDSYIKPNDGISLEEQYGQGGSLFTYYQQLIALRKGHKVIRSGDIRFLGSSNPDVMAFARTNTTETILVAINFSDSAAVTTISIERSPDAPDRNNSLLLGKPEQITITTNGIELSLNPYDVLFLKN